MLPPPGDPGRKTDVRDAEWIADLLRHGLLRASFVPSRPERELRELTRYRTSLIRERASGVNRIHKVLEGANIKLASVASNVAGVSGLAILRALVEGQADPAARAGLARGRMRSKRPALEEALTGSIGPHQRFILATMLRRLDELDRHIATRQRRDRGPPPPVRAGDREAHDDPGRRAADGRDGPRRGRR